MARTSLVAPGVVLALAVLSACQAGSGDLQRAPDATVEVADWPTWVIGDPARLAVPPPAAARPAAAGGIPSPGAAQTGDAERWQDPQAVWPWMRLALEGVAARTKDPPAASRAYALVAVATYDAVVAAAHWQRRYQQASPGPDPTGTPAHAYPSTHATVAGAAWPVLVHSFPEQPAARFERLARAAAAGRVTGGHARPEDVAAGLELGRRVGEAVVEHARRARPDRDWDGTKPTGPGIWEPPPGSVALPVTPLAGSWTPWVLESGDQFRPEPPPPYGSEAYLAEAHEVVTVDASLTAEQKRIAQFWEGGEGTVLPPGIWIEAVHAYVTNAGMDLEEGARAFALTAIALDDAGVSAWDAKYVWWTTRPVNAIRDLGIDEDWEPYLPTPLFPSYTSGHAVYSGAVSEVMAALFPESAGEIRARASEAAVSRLYGGIHFRSDNEVGLRQGRAVGRSVLEQVQDREERP